MSLTASHVAAQQPQQAQVDPEQLLQMAERAYEQLDYEQAVQMLVQVHQVPGVTPIQRARAFLYMGVCFTALGDAGNAVAAFVELLRIKSDFRLPPGISPSILAMFKEALLRLKLPEEAPAKPPAGAPEQPADAAGESKGIPVKLEARAPASVTAGQPVPINVKISDPRKLVKSLYVRWRRVGGPDFSSIKVPYKAGVTALETRIPGATLGAEEGRLQYVVEALGAEGLTLAHTGSLDRPSTVELTEVQQTRTKWGLWALGIGGGLAVAGGVVAAILLTRGSGTNGPGSGEAEVVVVLH